MSREGAGRYGVRTALACAAVVATGGALAYGASARGDGERRQCAAPPRAAGRRRSPRAGHSASW